MSQEDALFKFADALIEVWSKLGGIEPYMSADDFNDCLDACKEANKERYRKEIMIYF